MGRSSVQVQVGDFVPTQREPRVRVHLAVGMPANERMDWLVEKAAELGAASIQPLITERSVLRLSGERAAKKQLHWQSVAVAACEQCGGNRVPVVQPMMSLQDWLKLRAAKPEPDDLAYLLSLQPASVGLREALALQDSAAQPSADIGANNTPSSLGGKALCSVSPARSAGSSFTCAEHSATQTPSSTFLSGPEGGLSPHEEQQALGHGFQPVTLGKRVLRAETAALAALATLLV
jgi:16S rRNA (uracil1498-N3)-methyltransferase